MELYWAIFSKIRYALHRIESDTYGIMKSNTKILLSVCAFIITFTLLNLKSYAQPVETTPKLKYLRVGYSKSAFSGVNVNDAQVAMNMVSIYLNEKMGAQHITKTVIFDDVDTMIESIKAKEIDAVSMSTLEYLRLKSLMLPIEPFYVSIRKDIVGDEHVVLVNKKDKINNLSQLKGKKIIVEIGSNGELALLWFTTLLLKRGLPESDNFFSDIKKVGKISQAILPVFFMQADACIVRRTGFQTMVEMNPQINKNLIVLQKSPAFQEIVFCIQKDYDDKSKKMMMDVSATLHLDPKGKQMLLLFRKDRVIPFKPEHIESVESLIKEYNELKRK
jgi:phosphonate transport system substrate-binding protein